MSKPIIPLEKLKRIRKLRKKIDKHDKADIIAQGKKFFADYEKGKAGKDGV